MQILAELDTIEREGLVDDDFADAEVGIFGDGDDGSGSDSEGYTALLHNL
jgi:hypothetical protein